ncbi:MAG: thioredoxin family protein [Giesbergeria sp.]|nr:thioredoxin family protein [Giesbergeria sp.]
MATSSAQATSAAQAAPGWVVCLCAAWCRTCDAYRSVFDAAAAQYPGARFVWLDVEDEAALVDDLDIETFPTLLIADGTGQVRFWGPLLPQPGVLARMLTSLPAAAPMPEAQALLARISAAQAGSTAQ